MNLRERYDQLERRVIDLEERLQRLDGRQVVGTGGVVTDGPVRFAPGSGRIDPVGDARPDGFVTDREAHANCTLCDGHGDVRNDDGDWIGRCGATETAS